MNMYGLLMFTFLIFSFVEERNLIDCAVRSCSFRIGIRACSGLSSIMLFKNIPGVDVALKIQITLTLIACIVALRFCSGTTTNTVEHWLATKSTEGKMEQTILHQ